LHAVLPPIAAHPTLSLRILARRRFSLNDLVAAGMCPPPVADVLDAVVAARLAFVISGGTGTGKTTLLGALLGGCAPRERVVLIEDAPELVTSHQHVVRLTSRAPNIEGAGTIGLAELVRQALRMRPDRLVVGEFRGAEMVELLAALNTGHDGGAATLHANTAADVPARFAALGSLAGLEVAATRTQVASAFDVILHLRRGADGRRGVQEIAVFDRAGDGCVRTAWTAHSSAAGPAPRPALGASLLAGLIQARGGVVPELLQ
jgi:pilus assembly protein CpaF